MDILYCPNITPCPLNVHAQENARKIQRQGTQEGKDYFTMSCEEESSPLNGSQGTCLSQWTCLLLLSGGGSF